MRRTSTTKINGWNDKKTLARWMIIGYLAIFCSPLVSAAVVSDLFGTWNGTWFVDEIHDELNPPTPIAFQVDVQFNIGPFNPIAGNYGTILLDTATPGVISSITIVGNNVELLIDYPWANFEPSGMVTGILKGTAIVGDFDEVPTAGWVTGKGALEISKISTVPIQSFFDVPYDYWAYSHIELLAASGITSGCAGGNYCPENPVTRSQMAVFLVKTFGL